MTTIKSRPTTNTNKRCAYTHCGKPLPGPYGTPGVAMSRFDNKTLICSGCGLQEALNAKSMMLLKSF